MENFPMRIARSHEIRSESQKPARVRQDLAEFRVTIAGQGLKRKRAVCWSGSDSASSSLRLRSCRSLKLKSNVQSVSQVQKARRSCVSDCNDQKISVVGFVE